MPPAIRVPLVQGAYQARSVISSAQRSLNLYPETGPKGEDSPTTIYQTPGLTRLGVPAAASAVRGLYRATNGELFSAVGDGVYYVAQDFTSTFLGAIPPGSTPVKFGDNGTDMVIVDGSSSGWSVDLTTHVFTTITDPDFYGSNFVETLDTYLLFNKPGTPIFYSSDSNAITFDPLWFAAKSGYSDSLAGIAVRNRNLWLIGAQSSSEIWYDAGAADFPFAILPGPFVQNGTIAIYSIAKNNVAVFWLGQDENGTSFVVMAVDYKSQRISTPAIEYAISTYPVISDAVGFTYEQQGHTFYWLKFPSANNGLGVDWVYDMTTGLWHERSWMNPVTCVQEGHRAYAHAFCYGINIVGDRETGQLYQLDLSNPTDNGDFIERRRGYPHMMANGERLSFPSFVADLQALDATTTTITAALPTGIIPSPLYANVVRVIDTDFTAPNGTLLQDYYIPYGLTEVGAQFTRVIGSIDMEIQDNAATAAVTGGAAYLVAGKPVSPDYVAIFQVIPYDYGIIPDANKGVYIIGRADSGNGGYRAWVISDGTQYQVELDVQGISYYVVNAGLLTSGHYTLYLSMVGDAISLSVQRSEDDLWLDPTGVWVVPVTKAIEITDSSYTAAGNVLVGGEW